MRYDKWGQADALNGKPKHDFQEYPDNYRSEIQDWYNTHYDHIKSMLAAGVDPRRLNYADPDIRRTPEDYNKFPIVTVLFSVEHPDGTRTDYCHQTSSEEDTVFSYALQAPDDQGRRYNIRDFPRVYTSHYPSYVPSKLCLICRGTILCTMGSQPLIMTDGICQGALDE